MTNPSLMLIMRLALLGCFWTFSAAVSDDMIKISSAELKDLRPETETVLAFFTRRSGCSSCAAAADELRSVLPSLGMKTYLVEDGKETAEYADRVPALVMFHGHTPVLYEGPMEGDAFAEFVTTNREPRVVILNDDSFEHLTQAATGATTGDWLVMFHGLSCDSCAALEARLQGVAAKLRNRVMVAKMSSETDGRETAKRFGVPPKELQILFFRQGTMYLYNLKKFDLSSLSAFAVGLYKEAPSEPVPSLPQSPIMLVLQVIAVILVAVYILMMVLTKKNEQARKKGF